MSVLNGVVAGTLESDRGRTKQTSTALFVFSTHLNYQRMLVFKLETHSSV